MWSACPRARGRKPETFLRRTRPEYIHLVSAQPAPERVRLAELLAALSLGSDLGMGLPMEHVLRQCLIAMRLADRVGVDVSDRNVVYYTALLAWVGCHIDAYEQRNGSATTSNSRPAFGGSTSPARQPGPGSC